MTSSFLHSAKFYTLTQLLSSVAIFLRNLILARLLSVDDFGIASTFAIVMSFIEAFSTIGTDKYLLVTKDRPNKYVLGSAHFLFFVRGILVSVMLYLMSGWLARVFGVPDLVWAYQVLAIIPFLKGLTHFSYVLQQRDGEYFALSMFELSGQLASLIVVVVASLYYVDYRIALYAVMVTMILPVILSHFYARDCAYSLFPDKKDSILMLKFAWPIFLGSILIFAVLHGDKTIVGAYYSLADLAIFSIAFSLLSLPAIVLVKLYTSLYLAPMAQECLPGAPVNKPIITGVISHFFIIGFLALSGFSLLGQEVITLIYGERYEPSQSMVFLIALAMALRLMRTAPSLLAIASHNPVFGLKQDLARALAIIPAFYLASAGFELELFLWVAVFGEFIATILGFWLVRGLLGSEVSLLKISGLYLYFSVFVASVFFVSSWGISLLFACGILVALWFVFLGALFIFDRRVLKGAYYIVREAG